VLHARERGGRQVVIDTGMTELIRPALYGAHHPVIALTSSGRDIVAARGKMAGRATRRPERENELAPTRVEGPICEATDALGSHELPPLQRGDLVAIADAGAYGSSLSSTYNGRRRPAQVLLWPDGRLVLTRRRGTLRSLA
jgi:diaminopimelate decarboxylase